MDQGKQPSQIPDYFPDELPRFFPGQLVSHRCCGYRAVVVDFDMACRADDQWYESNQTQPDRDQPWYHLLVDGASINTYAAQQNLAPDNSERPIDHPLVEYFFEDLGKGRYERNEAIWPR